jgi:hypothetical protein
MEIDHLDEPYTMVEQNWQFEDFQYVDQSYQNVIPVKLIWLSNMSILFANTYFIAASATGKASKGPAGATAPPWPEKNFEYQSIYVQFLQYRSLKWLWILEHICPLQICLTSTAGVCHVNWHAWYVCVNCDVWPAMIWRESLVHSLWRTWLAVHRLLLFFGQCTWVRISLRGEAAKYRHAMFKESLCWKY